MQRETDLAEDVAAELMSGDVRDYLLTHPDFLLDNSDILAEMVPPNQRIGDGVPDFQHYMLSRLQENLNGIKGEHDDLMLLMQEHLQRQGRINDAVLTMLDVPDFQTLLDFTLGDMPLLLDHEVVRLFIGVDQLLPAYEGEPLPTVTDAFLYRWLENRDAMLSETDRPLDELFGVKARQVKSYALIKLDLTIGKTCGLLALGHRDRLHYATGLAAEQIECLGGVLQRCICKWLS